MIGVAGTDADAVAALVRETGAETRVLDGESVRTGDCDAVVAVGEAALVAVAADRPACPVLVVDGDADVLAVGRDDAPDAVDRLVAGDFDTRERALLRVTSGDRRLSALFDAMLVTTEPAQISEYGVAAATGAAVDGEVTIDSIRADGVVVATAVGSRGYARDAGGPTVVPGTEALAVVPVAPFTVDQRRWVVAPPVSLTVERDEGTVGLRVDGRDRGQVAPGEPVRIARDGTLSVVAVPESRRPAAMEKT